MKGDGSYYETEDRQGRKRWIAQLTVEGLKRPVRRWLPVGASEKDAKKLLRQLRDLRARGELKPKERGLPEPVKLPTIAEWMTTWLDEGAPGGRKGNGPGPRTLDVYRGRVVCDIAPGQFGSLRLDEVRRRDVRDLLDRLAKLGRSRATLNKELGLLVRAFRHAQLRYEEDLADRSNPAENVGLPRTKAPTKRRALVGDNGEADEVRRLLEAVEGDRLLDAWAWIGVDCAGRPGELAALRWPDLVLKADKPEDKLTVTLVKSLVWEPAECEHVGPLARISEGKTGEMGHRRLTISAGTAAVLLKHRKRLQAERLAAPPGYWPETQDGIDLAEFVFLRPDGRLVDRHYIHRILQGVVKAAGLAPVTPYELRHTGATLIDAHHDEGEVMAARALGHAPAGGGRATAGYLHRGLRTIDSTVLDTALDKTKKANDKPDDTPEAQAQ
jgi:integrase